MFKVIKSLTRSYGYSLQWTGPNCPSYIIGPDNTCCWHRYKRDAEKHMDALNMDIVATRASDLRAILDEAYLDYHQGKTPLLTDAEYDELYRELTAIENNCPELATADSPTQRPQVERQFSDPNLIGIVGTIEDQFLYIQA